MLLKSRMNFYIHLIIAILTLPHLKNRWIISETVNTWSCPMSGSLQVRWATAYPCFTSSYTVADAFKRVSEGASFTSDIRTLKFLWMEYEGFKFLIKATWCPFVWNLNLKNYERPRNWVSLHRDFHPHILLLVGSRSFSMFIFLVFSFSPEVFALNGPNKLLR